MSTFQSFNIENAVKNYSNCLNIDNGNDNIYEKLGFKRIVHKSLYVVQLVLWMQYFPRSDFLILKSEDLFQSSPKAGTWIYMYIHMHACMHTYMQTYRQTDRQT